MHNFIHDDECAETLLVLEIETWYFGIAANFKNAHFHADSKIGTVYAKRND